MNKKILLLTLLGTTVLIALIIFFMYGFFMNNNGQYETYNNDNYSLQYSNAWQLDVKEKNDETEVIIRDEKGEVFADVITPYRNPRFETHIPTEIKYYNTNDSATSLLYQYMKPFDGNFDDYAVLSWQKGCDNEKKQCQYNEFSGIIIVHLGFEELEKQERMKDLDEFIKNFQIL